MMWKIQLKPRLNHLVLLFIFLTYLNNLTGKTVSLSSEKSLPFTITELVNFYSGKNTNKLPSRLRVKGRTYFSNKKGCYDHFNDSLHSAGLDARVSYWLIEQDKIEYPFVVYRNKDWGKVFKFKFPKSYFVLLREELAAHGIDRKLNRNGFYLMKGLVEEQYEVQVVIEGDTEWGSIRIFSKGQFENLDKKIFADNTDVLNSYLFIPQLDDTKVRDHAYGIYDRFPAPPGNSRDFDRFIDRMVLEPFSVRNIRIYGQIAIGFVIAPDGRILHLDLLKKADNKLDQFLLYTFKFSPNWVPAKIEGTTHPVKYVKLMEISVR